MTLLYAVIGDWSPSDEYSDWDYEMGSLAFARNVALEWKDDPRCRLIQLVKVTHPDALENEWCLWDHLNSPDIQLVSELRR